MSKFKVGDVVKRTYDVESYCLHQGSPVGTVTSVGPMGWLQIDGWSDTSGNIHPWDYRYFRLSDKPADDPLPPAPESVLYNARSDMGCNLEVAALPANAYYDARIRIGVWNNTGAKQGKVTCLTPDAALQLAHDLRRMAMDIRRKERHVQA